MIEIIQISFLAVALTICASSFICYLLGYKYFDLGWCSIFFIVSICGCYEFYFTVAALIMVLSVIVVYIVKVIFYILFELGSKCREIRFKNMCARDKNCVDSLDNV